jgi:hypothetical protein
MSEVYGFKALEETFKNFEYKDKRNILLSAYRKATKPTIDAARDNAPKDHTGNLRRSIGLVPIRGEIGVYVGARIRGGFKGYHGYILEHGTRNRMYVTKNNVEHKTGHMTRTNFFKNAVASTEDQMIDLVTKEWFAAVDKWIVKNDR